MTYSLKEKKPNFGEKKATFSNTTKRFKKRITFNQNLRLSITKKKSEKKKKKSLLYLLLLKKFHDVIDYTNLKLLQVFLTKYGKIKARRKTRIPVQKQRAVAKAIRKARSLSLLPFVCDVIL